MTFREIIRGVIRAFILNSETQNVIDDIVNNGLTPADEAIIDAYLDTLAP